MFTQTVKRFITIATSAMLILACAAGGVFAELKDNKMAPLPTPPPTWCG